MLANTFVVLDFETTGLSPLRGDRITEVAAVRVAATGIVDRYESLVNCGVRIPPFISAYTGITQKMVNGAPPARRVLKELLGFVGRTTVIAHNASFDQRFFESECNHVGITGARNDFICSMRLSRRIFPDFPSHGLGSLAEELGIPFVGAAHRAGADAEVTAKLVLRLAGEIGSKIMDLSIDEGLLRRIMKMPIATALSQLRRMRGELESSKPSRAYRV
jgi:DNA polymerase-3 subunit epsilon